MEEAEFNLYLLVIFLPATPSRRFRHNVLPPFFLLLTPADAHTTRL
jgi:hypothetical protein